jgi:hypothetical protein
VGVHTDEVYFRDTAHGFLAWALATVLLAGVLGSALSAAVGAGVGAAANVASGAASGATEAAANAAVPNDPTGYFVDTLFRPADPKAAASATDDGTASAQATRILIASAAAGAVSDEDRAYLGQLVAARTGLADADAKARVDAVLARVDAAKAEAKQAADAARKASASFALIGALSLLIGAFIASAAAALGGRQRDDDEVLYVR